MIELREAGFQDVIVLGPRLTYIDALEAKALTGMSPIGALAFSVGGSDMAWTVVEDGVPIACFGAGPYINGVGTPWLLQSERAKAYPRLFVKYGHWALQQMDGKYLALRNFVHADNAPAIRWLRHLGFTVQDRTVSIRDEPFHRFTRISPCVP